MKSYTLRPGAVDESINECVAWTLQADINMIFPGGEEAYAPGDYMLIYKLHGRPGLQAGFMRKQDFDSRFYEAPAPIDVQVYYVPERAPTQPIEKSNTQKKTFTVNA